MSNSNRTIGSGAKSIRIDYGQIIKEEQELKRRTYLENYVVKVPTPSGAGNTYNQIQNMCNLVKGIYEDVEVLIAKTIDVMDKIGIEFKTVDEDISGKICKVKG